MKSHITIIGAGLGGCYLAILFAKRGFKVTLFEKLSKNKVLTQSSKRSFNLTFHNYAESALKEVGVWEEVQKDLIALLGAQTKLPYSKKPIFSNFHDGKLAYFTVTRHQLLKILVKKALEQKNISIKFNTSLINVDRPQKTIFIQNGKKIKKVSVDVLIGADGTHSLVRMFLQQGQNSNHSLNILDWEYKQVRFSKNTVLKLNFSKKLMHAWTSKKAIFIAFPNKDGSYSALLVLPKKYGFQSLESPKAIKTFIKNNFPELMLGINEITDFLLSNPEGYFVTMKTSNWYYKDFMAIIGDASHSMLPFIGQGITTAFADCLAMVKLVEKYGENWEKVFHKYQDLRKDNADTLVELSKMSFQNFRRQKRSDKNFIYYKLETILHSLFPFLVKDNIFGRIVADPEHADKIFKQHINQRRLLSFLGLPIIVLIIASLVSIFEYLVKLLAITRKMNLFFKVKRKNKKIFSIRHFGLQN